MCEAPSSDTPVSSIARKAGTSTSVGLTPDPAIVKTAGTRAGSSSPAPAPTVVVCAGAVVVAGVDAAGGAAVVIVSLGRPPR